MISMNDKDPVVMYLVVKSSLNMSIGKTAAQCAHASEMLQVKFNNLSKNDKYHQVYCDYLNDNVTKIVLKANDNDFEKLKQLDMIVVVCDAGFTEVPAGSETVIGVWPVKKSNAPKIIKKLRLL